MKSKQKTQVAGVLSDSPVFFCFEKYICFTIIKMLKSLRVVVLKKEKMLCDY